jgi:hypothetical protein
MTDRQLLERLFTAIAGKTCITMEDASLTDMVMRYQNPPLTALNRVAMQMTVREYNALGELMKEIDAHLKAKEKHVA